MRSVEKSDKRYDDRFDYFLIFLMNLHATVISIKETIFEAILISQISKVYKRVFYVRAGRYTCPNNFKIRVSFNWSQSKYFKVRTILSIKTQQRRRLPIACNGLVAFSYPIMPIVRNKNITSKFKKSDSAPPT